MNILILSVGTRNKVIQYFKKEFSGYGNVIVTDMQEIAPAIYEADKYYKVPSISDPQYVDIILDICKKEKISGVFSLIDPELSLLAKNKNRFEEIGVTIIGSSFELCERALDKMQMCLWLKEHGYNYARSYVNKEEFYYDMDKGLISFPVFVKPVRGSASIAINKVSDIETIELLFQNNNDLMIQEFLQGQEIGADCYIDLITGEIISIFTKKKILMRAGETDKAVSFKDPKLFLLIENFVKESGWRGQIDIDIFENNGEFFISEVNPRFGGGYPHAYECGCNHPKMILNNLRGISNVKSIGNYEEGIYMMKYNEVCIKKFRKKSNGN